MRILSTLGAGVRHVGVAVTEAALIAAIAVALVFAGAVATGHNPIGADQVAAKARAPLTSSSISLNADSQLWLGGNVTFGTTASGLTGSQYPMVVVACSQNGVGVYVQLDHPTATFLLGGTSSLWVQNGGSATCTATLYAYGGKTVVTLAGPITFTAGG